MGLSGTTTYYCKVQSKGDGSTYCEEGYVTDAAYGTTDNKDYTVTAASNNNDYGTAAAEDISLDEGETTTVTATAETGYKFRSWAVSGTGASLSSTTANPTTLTMGTANATVTATFSALEHYTITYNKGANGSGSDIANGDKTEDADFTLSTSKYTYAGHLQTGWSLTDGGEKAYDLGGKYTGNADLALYPYWIEQYTITYNSNGGTGSMESTEDAGSITLSANSYTKTDYTFIGWATSQDNADAGTVAYADKAEYTLSEDVTLYAVWAENYCEMKPATSGAAPSVGDNINMQSGAFGGKMTVTSSGADALSYTSNGLQSKSGYATTLNANLNDYIKVGSVISLKLYNISSAGSIRGYDIYTSDGKSKITTLSFTDSGETTLQYTITTDDGLDGTNGFQLMKTNNNLVCIKSLTVTDCQPGGIISASGWNTYASNKKLDLSTISGGTAYIATEVGGTDDKVKLNASTAIVNAEEGLMIKGTAGEKFTINTTSADATLSETNLMTGLPNGGTAPTGSYVFGWPTDTPSNYGFYYVNATEPTLGIGKAYLTVPSGARIGSRLTISINDWTTTGVEELSTPKTEEAKSCYNLQGQRITVPQKGLYIVNGRKYINK